MQKIALVFERDHHHPLHYQVVSNIAAIPLVGDKVAIGPNVYTVKERVFAPHEDELTDIMIVLD